MGFSCGIIGLPNVGKSTLFNAVTSAGADASNYPFCTIDPNVAVVPVPDRRLTLLTSLYRPQRTIPTSLEIVDIAGLVRGASKGEGLGNQFLARIREVDALLHVVRCFEDPNVVHVDGSVDPARDIEIVQAELILKDLDTVERKIGDAQHRARSGEKRAKQEADYYGRLREHLVAGRPARSLRPLAEEELGWDRALHLLTKKPVMYVCNMSERGGDEEERHFRVVRDAALNEGAPVVRVSARVEAEIAELPPEERGGFLRELGLEGSGLDTVLREGYALLHLVTFFTVGPKEVHAWTLQRGTLAPQAAGAVHSDFERGFIRAEVMDFSNLERLGSEAAVREHGLLHSEGRDYAVQDGDVIHFRFAV